MAEVNLKIKATDETRTGFQSATNAARVFGTNAEQSIGGSFRNIGASISSSLTGVLAGIGIGSFIRNTVSELSNVGDLAQQFGVSSETLQRLGQVASESGVSLQQVASALTRLTRNIQEAQNGTGEQAQALRDLGLSAKELAGLSPEQAFLRLADAVATAGDRNKAYAATIEIAGRSAGALIPVLQQGSKALQEQFDLISVVSDETVNKIKQVEDTFSRLGKQITASLGPAIAIIGQALLTATQAVQLGVQQAAGQVTSALLAVRQALQGNFRGAGDILGGEIEASKQRWEDFKKTVAGTFEEAAAGAPRPVIDPEANAASSNEAAARRNENTRRQIGEQLQKLRQQEQTPEQQLAELRQREQFLGTDRGGVSAVELERLRVVEQIGQLEKQIAAERERAAKDSEREAEQRQNAAKRDASTFAALARSIQTPEERRAALENEQAALAARAASLAPDDFAGRADVISEAQRIAGELNSLAPRNGGGTVDASALQRVGLASNEFIDTRKKDTTADEVKKANEFVRQIVELLRNSDGLYLESR